MCPADEGYYLKVVLIELAIKAELGLAAHPTGSRLSEH